MDGWCKDVAPSHALRRWFGHDPAKWTDFQRLYREELDERSYSWEPLLECAQAGTLTLLFSARDPVRNSAAVLQSYLEERVAKSRGRRHGTASAAR